VMLDASSATIDAFENAKSAGETVSPPKQRIPDEIAALLEKLALDRPVGWLAASLVLLSLAPRHQRLLARTLAKVAAGKKIDGATSKGADGATVARLRLDDPRLPGDTGEGVVLLVNRKLDVLDLTLQAPKVPHRS